MSTQASNEPSDRKPRPGKFVWFEHASRDAKKAQSLQPAKQRIQPEVAGLGQGFVSGTVKVRGGTGPAVILVHGFPQDARTIAEWSLADAVEDVLDGGEFPIVLGGDCSKGGWYVGR